MASRLVRDFLLPTVLAAVLMGTLSYGMAYAVGWPIAKDLVFIITIWNALLFGFVWFAAPPIIKRIEGSVRALGARSEDSAAK